MKRFFAVLLVAVMLLGVLPATSLAISQYGTVVGGWLRLRSAPNFNASTIKSYYTGTQVKIVGTSGSWYEVEAPDGYTGYMYSDYLRLGGGTPSGGSAYVTSRNGYGVRLRTGPGTGYRTIRTYAVGTPVTVLERGTYWSRIRINGTTGYMMSQFLNFGGSYPDDGKVLCYATIWSRNGYGVRLRTGPSKGYSKIGVYSVGTTVAVLEKGPVWDRVRVGSRVGWMMNEFLSYYDNNEVTSVTINNYSPVVGSVLSMQAVSPNGATVSYEWLVGGTLKSTNNTYTVHSSDVGKPVQLRVTGTGSYHGSASSAFTNAVVSNTVVQGVKLNTTAPVVGDVMTATLNPADAKVIYAWKVGGYQVSNATTYTVTANDVGKQIELIATGTGLFSGTVTSGLTAAVSATRGIADVTIRNNTNLTAGAAPSVGDKLTAVPSPAQATVTYQWNRNGTAISGATAADYTVADADVGAKLTVTVTGTGSYTGVKTSKETGVVIKKEPVLGLNMPAFAEVTEGYAPVAAQAITVANTGSATANISGVALSGANAGSFILNKTSGGTVESGKSDSASWTIKPADSLAAGTYAATVTFAYDGGKTVASDVKFVVKGAAPAPVPALTIGNVAFAPAAVTDPQPAAQNFTITNGGTANATISSAALTGPGVASFVLTNGSATIAAGATDTTYSVQPVVGLSEGTYSATLVVTYDGGLTAQADVSFTVTMNSSQAPNLSVTDVDFGSITAGSVPSARPISIANTGSATATLTQVSLSGANASSFMVNNNGSSHIDAGATDTSWNVQPVPNLAAGDYTATVTVEYNGAAPATATIKLTVSAPAAQQTVQLNVSDASVTQQAGALTAIPLTIANTSGLNAIVQSVAVSGSDFTTNDDGSTAIAANTSDQSWKVIPNASLAEGSYSTTVTVTYNKDGAGNTYTATATVNLTVSAASINSVPPGGNSGANTINNTAPGTTGENGGIGGSNGTDSAATPTPVPQSLPTVSIEPVQPVLQQETGSQSEPVATSEPTQEPTQEPTSEPLPEPQVSAEPVLSIRTDQTAVSKGKTLQMFATINDTDALLGEVTWSLTGAKSAVTAIDSASGLLSVAADETASSLTVTATLASNSANTFSVPVTVKEPQ